MQESAAGLSGNFIDEKELLLITQKWFEDEQNLQGKEAKEAAQLMVQGLWERNYLLCPRGPGLFGFLHRTFMEYLTALEYVRRFEKTKGFEIEDLDAVFQKHGNKPEWREVLMLICGMVGDQWAEGLIKTLLTLKPFPLEILNEENQPNHLVLGIRCMGELRGIVKMTELGIAATEACLEFLKRLKTATYRELFMTAEFLEAIFELAHRWPMNSTDFADFGSIHHSEFVDAGSEYFPGLCFIRDDRKLVTKWVFAKFGTHDGASRIIALNVLARFWHDDTTRELLTRRATADKSPQPRSQALNLLAKRSHWSKHPDTQGARKANAAELISNRSGLLACAIFGDNRVKNRVFTRDADGFSPFLDPVKPVSGEHLEKVSKITGLSDEQMARVIEEMSEELGWDLRKGHPSLL